MELTMPGPKPKSQTCFKLIYEQISRLHNISENEQQLNVLRNLVTGLKTIEPLWHTPENAPRKPLTPFEQGYQDYPDTSKNLFPADSVEADQWWQGYAAKDAESTAANPVE
jgi:hypothetical protein